MPSFSEWINKYALCIFHEALQHYIFQPLEMNHSYLAHYSESIVKSNYHVADLYGHNINITQYRSLSIDYAGGGIVATSEDLLKFMKALVTYEIIREDTFEKMKDWAKFSIGIDYGYGLMNFRTIHLLMPKKYNVCRLSQNPPQLINIYELINYFQCDCFYSSL